MIKISNLNKKYGKHEVLKDINLELKGGSIFGLLGPNGAGKTTLISTLVGLNSCDSGKIIVDNKNIKDELAYIQSISSLIPQNLAFYPSLTTKENLEFFGGMLGLHGNSLKSRIEYVINITKLNDVYNQEAKTYSGGLKRRLNIAIGLISDPKIIYFDEPTVGIDPQSRNFILESIKEMKEENRLIVYTSHYMQEVEFLCDEIAIIDRGEIIRQGDLNSLLIEFKATIKTADKVFEIEIDKLSQELERLKQEGEKIESIDYGHHLENYFLKLTQKELRD
ncbi:MAG TPA: ABC transporter ATP-binding protein [Campylobacterales bacterium]|nr:ABC transporter ATP-binding protein [Campylobacterales bacterium]